MTATGPEVTTDRHGVVRIAVMGKVREAVAGAAAS